MYCIYYTENIYRLRENMADIKLKKRKECTVAYIEHVGSYDSIPFDVLMKKLFTWAKENRAKPGFKPLTIYPDDPATTPAASLRSWVGIPIRSVPPQAGEVRTIVLPESQIVTVRFAGPSEEYSNTYRMLAEWAKTQGYECTGPPVESYPRKPKVKGGKTIIYADIHFPVRKVG
jgi:effector-binding domain-containing protein